MNPLSALALGPAWFAIVGIWLGWQLLRQNGRLLLRVDELEKRLNEIEFSVDEERAGLPAVAEAPAFELPELGGENRTLAEFRGQSLVLIFFNPACGFCRELLPKLKEKVESRKQKPKMEAGSEELGNGGLSERPSVLIITTGDVEANRALFEEHHVSFPVLLQKDSEVASAYRANGTPSGYLLNAEGKIASPLAMGAKRLLTLASGESPIANGQSEIDPGHDGAAAAKGEGRESRFNHRSLAGSKVKRDGLKSGTPAPDFRLPRLDGRGELSLSELRGRRVLLVFSSPSCGPCNTLAPELEKFHRSQVGRVTPRAPRDSLFSEDCTQRTARPTFGTTVVMASKGEPKENRAKVKEHGLTFPVVLQQQWEISRRYAMFATPIAYLIDEAGVIVYDVAVGVEPILALMAKAEAIDLVPKPAEAQHHIARMRTE